MILRKPYAFFIKHFKFFNVVLTALEVYIIYRLSLIVQFLFEYSNYPQGAIGQDLVGNLLSLRVFIIGIIIILFSIILIAVLSFKKKPIKLYLFITAFNVILLIILFIIRNYLEIMSIQIIEERTAFAIRDFSLIGMIISIFVAILTSIRSLGFDIKKFQFGQDLHDLNISDEDNEEFEIQLDVDSHSLKRKINKNIRHFKYFVKEHKLGIVILITILIGFGSYYIYSKSGIYYKITRINNAVKLGDFSASTSKGFITQKDYKGNKFLEDEVLVVIPIKIKSNNVQKQLNVTNFALKIGSNKFYHTENYKDKINDLGTVYDDRVIGTNFENYTLVFSIPKKLGSKNKMLEYHNGDDTIEFQVKLNNLDDLNETSNYTLNSVIDFNNVFVNKGTFIIGGYELSDKFPVYYNFCITTNECYKSYEYIVPNYKSNYDKTLLKITGKLNLEESVLPYKELGNFIANYGSIIYVINGETKNNINLKQVLPQRANINNTCYIEVLDEVKTSEQITLQIKLRNYTYLYKLK